MIKYIILVLIIFYAVIRIPLLSIQAIGNDEKRDIGIIESNLSQDKVIYHGARFSHKGHIPSPIYYNLLTWGYQLTDSLLGMRWMVFLFNLTGVIMLLYFLSDLLTYRVILFLGIFIVVSPWLVKYGIFSWNPNFLPMVSAGYFVAGYKTLTQERSFWILPALLFLFFGISMHVITFPFIIAFLFMLIILPRKINWFYGGIAITIIMIVLSIYLYFDAKNNWWNTRHLFILEDKEPYKLEALKVLQYLLLLTTTEISHFIKQGFHNVVEYLLPWYQASCFVIALTISSLITLIAHYHFWIEQYQKIKKLGFREYLLRYPLFGFISVNVLTLILFSIVLGKSFVPRYGLIAVYFVMIIIVWEVDRFLTTIKMKSELWYRIYLIGWIILMVYNLYFSLRISHPHPLNHIFY